MSTPSHSRTFGPAAFFLFLLVLAAPALGQGSRADYERANSLTRLTQGTVFKDRVAANWFAGGNRFWYRNDLRGGAREFVHVHAVNGVREPAFDHVKLADALAKATGKPAQADRLPIDRLRFHESEPKLVLYSEGKAWECDLRNYAVRESAAAPEPEGSLRQLDRPRASTRTGVETAITFVNRTDGDVAILWLDSDGERQPYRTLRAGERYEQHTYAGHVWLVVGPDGRRLGVFEAAEKPATAIVDGRSGAGPGRQQGAPRMRNEAAESLDGRWRAFVRDHNLSIRDLKEGQEFGLSSDGKEGDAYENSVYWSPDSTRVVALKTKQGSDRRVTFVESSPRDQLQPKVHSLPYRKPGDEVDHPRPRLFDVAARKEIPLSDALFPNPWSLERFRWEPDSKRFTFVYNQRGHQVLRVIAVDAATGKAQAIVDEQSNTFIDYAHKQFVHFLAQTGEMVWMSERDGWNHLYLYDARSGTVKHRITRGDWVVRGVERVDEAKGQVWFRASGIYPAQDPYYVHHCRINLDGTGLLVLTEGDGTHAVEYSPDRRFFVDTWSRVDLPPVSELRRAADGKLVCELERADWSALLATGWRAPERFAAKGRDGKTDIHGVIYRPTTFDPAKRYPVLEDIYAGPQGSSVPKAFARFHSGQVMAELGFIVVEIDGMGTSNRSKSFHDVCWKNLGDAGFPDRILWIRAAARKYPYLDLTRVGLYGNSAGGQNALRGLLAHPEFYRAAVAACGCHDNRMDKIWWNELWMGWPVGPHYDEQSNVTQAHRLQGKLLLIGGEMDRNVDPASTMQVVNALVRADKDFELVVVPGAGHGNGGPYGARRQQDFFVRHLLGVEPRWGAAGDRE